jgi:hypothetical protein
MNQLSFLEPAGLKAISLWQPWASLVALGAKKFETRSWETPYRGPLLIHAAKKWNQELATLATGDYFYHHLYEVNPRVSQLPKGCYIALVDLVAIYPTGQVKVTYGERLFGDYSAGRYAWQLENVRTFEPIPARGYQALWNPLNDMDPKTKQMLESLYNAPTQ